jgi:electron-transferring-flavoprotein dehydrogenase
MAQAQQKVQDKDKGDNQVSVLIVGAGPAGLAAAIALKKARPQVDVVVIDKAAELGNHTLSGAVLDAVPIRRLLDLTGENWRDTDEARELMARQVVRDDIYFLPGRSLAMPLSPLVRLARFLNLSVGQMVHLGDYVVSISKLTRWLGKIARGLGVEVLNGFAASDILLDEGATRAVGVKLVDRGLEKHGKPQPNFLPGETIEADIIILAEGCDGLLTERFVEKAGLRREANPLFSIGVKELIKVSDEQYKKFGDARVIHAMGYPLWTPLIGPGIFGGGIAYSYGDNSIVVGMIAGLDWRESDFNAQDALAHFKNHRMIRRYIEGGKVIEAGAKMIPEGGLHAIPRDPATQAIGKANVLIVGDSAGLVNMLKIKGLHNAIDSGIIAGQAAAQTLEAPLTAAPKYTTMLGESAVMKEMTAARNFRQTIAHFGNTVGLPLSVFANILPRFKVEPDYAAMNSRKYRFKGNKEFDKNSFIALAHTEHREEQPSHLLIREPGVCTKCQERFGQPCVTFCPAGVYECVQGTLQPANALNCLHCKTCQRKCPYDNIRWTVPEGTGGPRYKRM